MTTIQLGTTPNYLGNRALHCHTLAALLLFRRWHRHMPMALPRTLWFGSKPGNYASIQPRQPATAAASHLVRREQSGSPDLPGYVPRVRQTVLLVILRPAAVSHASKTARPAKSGSAVASSADTRKHSPVAAKTVYTDRLDQAPATSSGPEYAEQPL